jgi:hypothetical protein
VVRVLEKSASRNESKQGSSQVTASSAEFLLTWQGLHLLGNAAAKFQAECKKFHKAQKVPEADRYPLIQKSQMSDDLRYDFALRCFP